MMIHCDRTSVQKHPCAPNNMAHMIDSEIYVEGGFTGQITKIVSHCDTNFPSYF